MAAKGTTRGVDEEDEGPPVLHPQTAGAASASGQSQAPILAIPQPKPNTVVLVKTPDGRTLLISNKPQTPGGPCVITYQYVQLPLTQQTQSQQTVSQTTTQQSTIPQRRVEPQGGRLQITAGMNRQPSLIRPAAAAAPSVMNDHVYRGTQSPQAGGHSNSYMNRSQGGLTGSGPGRYLNVQPRRPIQQQQRQSSWYQDDYYDEADDDGAGEHGAGGYFDEYSGGGGGDEYFMDEGDESGAGGGSSMYLRGNNDGPPELEPMGAVPFLRAVSGYGGHVYRRTSRPSGGYPSGGSYAPGRLSTGVMIGGSQNSPYNLNRRAVEIREKVDRRR